MPSWCSHLFGSGRLIRIGICLILLLICLSTLQFSWNEQDAHQSERIFVVKLPDNSSVNVDIVQEDNKTEIMVVMRKVKLFSSRRKTLDEWKIAEHSLGVRVHRTFSDLTNKTYYEVDDIPPPNLQEFESNAENKEWEILEIPDEKIETYLLKDEILSSYRDEKGNSNASFCHNFAICCLSSINMNGVGPRFYSSFKDEGTNFHRDNSLWSWYFPPNGREARGFVDSLELFLDRTEMKKKKKKNGIAHMVIIGDSGSEQIYSAMLCSIQRTLGARVVSRRVVKLLVQSAFRIRVTSEGIYNIPVFLEESLVEINSTNKDKGIRSLKISYINQHRTYFDDIKQAHTHAILKSLCGFSFEATNAFGNGSVHINGNQEAGLILVNHGLHYNNHTAFTDNILSMLDIVIQCKKKGTKVIFRETGAQQFRFNIGGDYKRETKHKNNLPDLPGRQIKVPDGRYCAPIVIENVEQMNWRFQDLQKEILHQNKQFRLFHLDQNSNMICKKHGEDGLLGKIDYLPAFASTAPFWRSRAANGDCTHYFYSPGVFLSIFDNLFKILFRDSLKVGECHDISNDPPRFLQGPLGLAKGIANGHSKDFLPTNNITQQHISVHANIILDPVLNILQGDLIG